MTHDTYEAIKVEWCKISSEKQRWLIYQFVKGDDAGLRGSWMEFLQKQFKLVPPRSTQLSQKLSVQDRVTCSH